MKKRKMGIFTLAIALIAGMLAGCGKKTETENITPAPVEKEGPSVTDTPVPTNEPEATPTPEPSSEPTLTSEATPTPEASPQAVLTSEPAPTSEPESKYNIPDISMESFEIPQKDSFQFVHNMKIGWNLGNTLDAVDCDWLEDELDYESAWVSVKTTDKLIQAVKDAGFNTIRVPVSWHNHVSGENYEISEAWITRVQEIVDMAINKDMYVILNIHHDNSADFYYPTSEYLEQSKHYVSCIWQQIAAHFADYSDHLIFECLNEPRMIGTTYEWWINPNDESCKDAIACINELNQTIVDTIRAAGGNNPNRYIMVPGYDASPDGALNAGFILPQDSAEDKLIVSVHAYTPYNFALDEAGTSSFDSDKAADAAGITEFMDKLYKKFVAEGVPVVIGEFGARSKRNVQDRIDFSTCYIAAARARGITCCWWDNNAFIGNGELFGLIDRGPLKWRFEEIVTGLMKYAENIEDAK